MEYDGGVPKILVVDDDSTVRGVVADYLKASGMEVDQASDGLQGLEMARTGGYDLLVLDLMLPHIDGLEVFRRLRQSQVNSAVVMLTARGEEADRILGFELGADDYLTKPFSPRELVLRIQSVLRRGRGAEDEQSAEETRQIVEDGDLALDLKAGKASRDGQPLGLTLREHDLLAFLVTHPNEVFSREKLMVEVWGSEYGDPSTVTVHVRRLRGKIEADASAPKRLVTVWGRGYRWEPAETPEN
ncbi:DNA-binding response regulator [Boudabousia marimammalium]|uniref:DNA-binding response regulator n=2 Tax=Boudabousia marimammalium TaxID=156892 RepID=A0A1Q5PSU9_9ACTO|nr:DNA-binding response regulator [Boudabousia marimammalium]